MVQEDTIKILKECNSGVKMGVSSIEEILDNVQNSQLKKILSDNKTEHQRLGSEIHQILNKYDESGKEPNVMAKGMSWLKSNVMMAADTSDHTVADLITDGCNMGVKSLNRYLNKYAAADEQSKDIAKKLIDLEHQLTIDIRPYL
ncbi:hypothetical protein [Acetivibrio sp. MSJd-27]|uniref:hypothetical protein n=1 Tax=Acetivibrio sp. MSJd-27 TaxID=2841523 RepID=UPI001C107BB6|nr:hypothetical protein [Acetivibrio sp. MSJd-27]MBU5449954.1 hypothetical protein [Acetivibrio sp. MSJd-27]